MLRIEMPRKELTIEPQVTVGNRNRYSTATAVADSSVVVTDSTVAAIPADSVSAK